MELSRGCENIGFLQDLLGSTSDVQDTCIWSVFLMSDPIPPTEVFHVPLMIVHPILDECGSVVRPSWVMTEEPSIVSCQRSDFYCNWTHSSFTTTEFSCLILWFLMGGWPSEREGPVPELYLFWVLYLGQGRPFVCRGHCILIVYSTPRQIECVDEAPDCHQCEMSHDDV